MEVKRVNLGSHFRPSIACMPYENKMKKSRVRIITAFREESTSFRYQTEYQYLIELGPGDTKWIVEEEKWALKRARLCGMC